MSDSAASRIFRDIARADLRHLEAAAHAGEYVPVEELADAHAALQDTTETLRLLDSMVTLHHYTLCCVRLQPQFGFLRNNPR